MQAGRTPHCCPTRFPTTRPRGRRCSKAAPYATLSGGEKQRVLLARALAQQTPVLILDEPTNHLDVRAQLELLELVRGLGVTTMAALHELNLAAVYFDRLYAMLEARSSPPGRWRRC